MLKYLKASHLGPTLLVTSLAFFLAHPLFTLANSFVIALTIFSGQLIVGWTNELVDVESDKAQGRLEKPLVTGELKESSLLRSLWIDLPICVGLSLLGPLGIRGGLLHLFGVGCGVSYNFYFKRTLFSLLPYTFAFAALPSAAFVAREMAPPLWMVVVGAGFGTIAHFANVLKDLDADRELGINGLPQRIGMKYSVSICVLILIAITPIVATHRPHYGAWAYAALLASLIALIVKPRKLGFAAIMALALVDVLLTAVAHN
jgi:4-hydroxybenzoate polyprenyltransferase